MAGIRYCESCGAPLQEYYRFCEACGAPVRVPASGPSDYGLDVTSPGYGDVPDFSGRDYGYGGYDIDVPPGMMGGNDAFVGAVPPPAGGGVSSCLGDTETEILGGSSGDRPGVEYPGSGPGRDVYAGDPGFGHGRDVYAGDPGSGHGRAVYGEYPESGHDVYPGDVPPVDIPVSDGFKDFYSDGPAMRRDRRSDEPAGKPKIKSSMGPASAKGKGASVSEEAKPYFRGAGDL